MHAWGETVWSRLRFETLLRGVVRRVLTGKEPHPWWMPRRVLTVVSADVDAAAGIGAIWIVWRPESSRMREHLALMEWYGEQWRYAAETGPSSWPWLATAPNSPARVPMTAWTPMPGRG